MDGRINPFVDEQEDYENSPEDSKESPPSGMFSGIKNTTSTSSPRRSTRRAVKKRVVSVPIKDVEGSRLKGEMSSPPSDSWAWRKYGQKPIKGSPYPRGYYRCSSSKGCPARKQVERSRANPTMLMVTYSCEHNHSWPASRNNHNRDINHNNNNDNNNDNKNNNKDVCTTSIATSVSTSPTNVTTPTFEEDDQNKTTLFGTDEKFNNILEGSLISEFGWFMDSDSNSSTMLESPFLARDYIGDSDIATIFSTREEDESLFADLGELPECSVVFRRGEEERRRCSVTPLCGTTG